MLLLFYSFKTYILEIGINDTLVTGKYIGVQWLLHDDRAFAVSTSVNGTSFNGYVYLASGVCL